MKRVVIVLGSPRKKGNSTILAQKAADGVRAAPADARLFHLHDMNIRPCNACDSCLQEKNDGCCSIDDDMQMLYPELRQANALIIASPIYIFTVTAQIKLFLDRCRPLWESSHNIFKGMPIGILLTYGDTDPFNSGAVNAIRTLQDACTYLGAHIAGMVYGSASEAGEIRANKELLDKAYSLGKQLGQI
ncbi:flavodoxin family protein [Chloroflexota bacterium]